MKHPIQPLYRDDNDIIRFKDNSIVRFLKDTAQYNLNDLAKMPFPKEDWEQFVQLIGYSVSGFFEFPYVSDDTYKKVSSSLDELKIKELNND